MKLGSPEAMRQEPSNAQFEEREARRDVWDEERAQREHEEDLRYESLETEEREASGYWDNYPEEVE